MVKTCAGSIPDASSGSIIDNRYMMAGDHKPNFVIAETKTLKLARVVYNEVSKATGTPLVTNPATRRLSLIQTA